MPFSGLTTMSPGGGMNVPGNIGGGGKRPSNWWALAAAPIAALIAQGIGGVDFGEGIGAFGQGFANEKYNQLKQRRQSEFEEEGRTIDLAHKVVQDLKDIDSSTLQKFPQLQSLSQKYQEALADDGKISTKEAKEIVVLNQHLQHELQQAKTSQGLSNREAQMRQTADFEENRSAEQLARGMPGLEGVEPDQLQDIGRSMMDQQRLAEFPQLMSVNFGGQERQISMTPKEQFQLSRDEERFRQAEAAEKRRQESAEAIEAYRASAEAARERGLGMRESAADLRDQLTEWRQNKEDALDELLSKAGVEKKTELDAKELAEFNAAWETVRPRRGNRAPISPPPKVETPAPNYGGKNYSNVRIKK